MANAKLTVVTFCCNYAVQASELAVAIAMLRCRQLGCDIVFGMDESHESRATFEKVLRIDDSFALPRAGLYYLPLVPRHTFQTTASCTISDPSNRLIRRVGEKNDGTTARSLFPGIAEYNKRNGP